MASTQPSPRTFPAPLVGTSSIQVAPQNLTRAGVFVYNPNAAITLAICAGDTTPVINGPGTITLGGNQGVYLDGWTIAINAIAQSGAANSITVLEFFP